MTMFNVAQAKAKLSELIARAEAGEQVVIARDGEPAVLLVPARPAPRRRRRLGVWAHLGLDVKPEVFLAPDPDLEAAAHGPIFPDAR